MKNHSVEMPLQIPIYSFIVILAYYFEFHMSFLTINKFKTSKSSSEFLEVHIFALYTFQCNKLVVQPGFHYNKCILKIS